ncbi:hypothetical protein GGX14DRAFT_360820 [Mycena pura]|uniref:Uncharacterized protein n=1 Tax=Mycena pura TaxID=153505 RepID=A0AAD6VQI2_9AGAR|nr:hypothetical protein GGX14DRAFT_360820 [Mycena pura]
MRPFRSRSWPDDLLIVSLSARGLHVKLATLRTWCSNNFILVNLVKTIILIYGKIVSPLPIFRLGTTRISVKTEEKYVGVILRTDTQNMFADHYKAKARTARQCGHRIWAIEDMTGRLRPKELKQLYMARVDCHLIHGCEIPPDSEDMHVKHLCKVQINFLRQMLNIHRHSMIVPLFTETGIKPLQVCRLLLVLSHLMHWLGRSNDMYARAALNSSIELAANSKKSLPQELPFQCPILVLMMFTTIGDIEDYSKLVHKLMLEWLQGEIDSSEKLYLLHDHREPQKDKGPAQVISCMRHYLMVKTQKHQEAITSIKLSTHLLALEILRYVNHGNQPVPRSDRLCRFCRKEVESPEHALITYTSSDEVLQLRVIFLERLFTDLPDLQCQMAELSITELLKAIIYPRSSITLVAKFMYQVLEVFYAVPCTNLMLEASPD